MLASGRGVFELTGYREQDLLGRDVRDALGLRGADGEPTRSASCSSGACASSTSGSGCATPRRAATRPSACDVFPAYDDDGGLLASPRARRGATDRCARRLPRSPWPSLAWPPAAVGGAHARPARATTSSLRSDADAARTGPAPSRASFRNTGPRAARAGVAAAVGQRADGCAPPGRARQAA